MTVPLVENRDFPLVSKHKGDAEERLRIGRGGLGAHLVVLGCRVEPGEELAGGFGDDGGLVVVSRESPECVE